MTYPEKTTATAPIKEIGYQLANGYYWWLYENETTTELVWPQSVYVYDQMRRTDAQVGSVLRAVTLPVLRTPWRVDPNGARREVVEFIADDLGLPVVGEPAKPPKRIKDRFSWQAHLSEALLMLPLGYSYFEQVYRVDPDGKTAHLRKLALRPAKTIQKINVAKDGGLISIEQYWAPTDSGPNVIPVDRLVAYIHAKEGGNWLGTSLLRNCYKNWLLKDRLLRVQAQTIERNGMGIPRYTAQDGASEADMALGLAMARAWRSGESAGVSLPFGAALDLVGVNGTLPEAEPAIRYHDEQIARAVLAHFLNLGTQTGSWALGSTFADFFTLSLQTLAQQIADVATCHVVEDLVDINFGEDEPAPRIVFDEIGSRQSATAESLKSLVDAGVIRPDDALEGQARQYYGLPPADPSTVRTPPNPSAQDAAPAPDQFSQSVAASAQAPVALGEDVDELADEIVAALEQWVADQLQADVAARAHDVGSELRIPGGKGGGRWTKSPVTNAIAKALEVWGRGEGPDDPFHIDGKPMDREPLRKAAVARGITLRRRATREEIVAALKDDVRGEVSSAREADKQRKASAKFSITHNGKRIDVAVFTDQGTGKTASLRETDDLGHPGRVITSQPDLAGLEKWAGDNGHSDIASWAAKERGGSAPKVDAPKAPAKRAPAKKSAPKAGVSGASVQSELRKAGVDAPEGSILAEHLDGADASDQADLRERVKAIRHSAATHRSLASMRLGNNNAGSPQFLRGKRDLADSEQMLAAADVLERLAGGPGPKPKREPDPAELENAGQKTAVPVRVLMAEGANSDSSSWKATGFDGLDRNVPGATAAVTRYLRSPGFANTRLRNPEPDKSPSGWQTWLHNPSADELTGRKPFDEEAERKAAAQVDRHVAALDRVMDQSRLTGPMRTYRGARSADIGLPDGSAVGHTWTDAGFVSTATSRGIAEHSFSGGDKSVLMTVRVPEGTPALQIGGLGETEVLLGRGQTYRVVADHGKLPNGSRHLEVEVVPPDAPKAPAKVAAPKVRKAQTAEDIRDLVVAQREAGASKSLDAELAHLDDKKLAALHDEIAKGGDLYDRATAKKVQDVLDRRRGTTSPAAAKVAKAKAAFDAEQTASRLRSASTREEAQAALDGLTKPQLLAVANEHGMTSVIPSLSRETMLARMIDLAGAGRYDSQTAYLANMESEGGRATLRAPDAPSGVVPIHPKQDFSVTQGVDEKLAQAYSTARKAASKDDGLDRLTDSELRRLATQHGVVRVAGRDRAGLLEHLRLRDVQAPSAAQSPSPAAREVEVENRIKAAYRAALAAGDPGFNGHPTGPDAAVPGVRLSAIRDRIGGDISTAEVDEALRRLGRQDGIHVGSEENQKTLTAADRAAEVSIGGQGRNMLTVYGDASKPRAVPTPESAAPASPDLVRRIADAEDRAKTTRERLAKAQAAFDAASRDPKADALGEHFPLGTGGSGGGRQGSTDAQLRRYVEARKARDAAHSQNVRAEAQLKELTARRDAAGKYSRETVSAGDAIKVDGLWHRVQKANAKTVQVDAGPGMDVKYRWDQVTDHRPAVRAAVHPGQHYRHGWIPIAAPDELPDDLSGASVDDLTDAFRTISSHPPGTAGVDEALTRLDAELARREGTPDLAVDDTPESRRIDKLVARGRDFLSAYAEVHDLDPAKLDREQRMQLVDLERRPGESRAKTIRRMHFEHVAVAVLQAEDDTEGNLLNRAGRSAGIDPATLWSGPASRARKYASDELKQWWSEHGGRVTAAEFAAQFTGDKAASESARLAGQGKDFGV